MKMRRFRQFSALLRLAAASGIFVLGTAGWALAIPVPEIDPGTASSGLALVAGAVLLLREVYRRRRSSGPESAD